MILILAGLALVGCDQRKPALSDEEFNMFRAENPGMKKQCLDSVYYGGFQAWDPFNTECFEWTAPRVWRGVWNIGFEWSNFCPDPAATCAPWFEGDEMWLRWADGSGRESVAHANGTYRIEFVGRQTKVRGHFGHLNQYPHMMMIVRLISIRKIPEPKEASKK
jgi:hypothetical protein